MFNGKALKCIVAGAIVLSLIISGCVSAPQPKATPTPTATPAAPVVTKGTPVPTPTVQFTAPSIRVTSYPATADGEKNFTIKWEVSGGAPGTISHTAVHWGFNHGNASISDYPRVSLIQTGKTPMQFSVDVKAPASGTIYFRAHAIVDGMHVYADEYQITIISPYTGAGGGGY